MRDLVVSVDGKHFRGSWDTWEDNAWGRMVEVRYRDAWQVRLPVGVDSPEHAAERALKWCIQEAVTSDRRR
jgi:hypothetical protein